MNNREEFKFYKKHGMLKDITEEDRIEKLVNLLLQLLYVPTLNPDRIDAGLIVILDHTRLEEFHIQPLEPVNWGSLNVSSVEKSGPDNWTVYIEEASPGDCPTLCDYIERYMNSWGWKIQAKTEW